MALDPEAFGPCIFDGAPEAHPRDAIVLALVRRTLRRMTDYTRPPDHTSLTGLEVIERYGRGTANGDQRAHHGVPGSPAHDEGRFRLDTPTAWAEGRPAGETGARFEPSSTAEEAEAGVAGQPRRRRTRGPRP